MVLSVILSKNDILSIFHAYLVAPRERIVTLQNLNGPDKGFRRLDNVLCAAGGVSAAAVNA